ncbi:MAG TPA: fumarylacetoacetate hydrolase family protein [Gammaproteobacteria bacterium]|jgi:2-dehydro-3-deoxy-D-arabinonate dehydratase
MMKLYKLKQGVLVEFDGNRYWLDTADWDELVNDDQIIRTLKDRVRGQSPVHDWEDLLAEQIDAPMQGQELWASGVTYERSRQGRQEESQKSGGADFYARVYEAERPELFFKAPRHRVVGTGGVVRIRADSEWDVPEPELVLAITRSGKIIGYSIGNDMSSRSIEGENPLYLPQAKCYDGCAALGPCIYLTDQPLPGDTRIELSICRAGEEVFGGDVEISRIKRKFEDLVAFLYRECSFPNGALLMTGTGIVPGSDFTLQSGDEILITIACIGTLVNRVA